LINEASTDWKAAAGGVIMRSSEIWGGRHFLLIPTDGERIKDKFWELLEAYSPDHIAVYNLTFADKEVAEPTEYASTRSRLRDDWNAKNYGSDFDEWFEKQAEVTFHDKLTISITLERQLIDRLSPFHFQDRAVQHHLSRQSGFGFPLTKISDIISFTTTHIGQVALPKKIEDPVAALLVHSQTGSASSGYCSQLKEHGFTANPLPDNYPTPHFVQHIFGGKGLIADTETDYWRPTDDYLPRTPFGLSMLHLGRYYTSGVHLEYREPVVVVIGDTADDFCLYYSLSRMHEQVCWLPLAWLRNCYRSHMANYKRYKQGQPPRDLGEEQRLTYNLIDLFWQLIEYGQGEKRVELRSMSLNVRQLSVCRKQMTACCMIDPAEFASRIDCIPIERSSTGCILRVFEQDNYSNNETVSFVGNDTVSPFPTPRPKNFSEVRPSGHYWLTSLRVEGYEPPPLPVLGTEIVNMHGLGTLSRVANDGIVYHCPNVGYFGGGIDAVLVRPKIHLPDEMALLSAYFGSIGVTIQLSDKGKYLADTLERFGGLDALATFVKNGRTRRILDKFMSKKIARDGSIIYLNNDQRTYLNLTAIKAAVRDIDQAAALVDDLIGKRVLERGYILHCERCSLSSWYSLDVLTSEFTCNRCSFQQQFTVTHWKQPVEPHWYYRLAETVYQFYLHNSHLTAQALWKLKSQSKLAFQFVPEIDLIGFPSQGKKRELDIACILDGQIIIGEGKTEDLHPRDADKFETLLKMLGKRPDCLVFATAQTKVSSAFRSRIATLPGAEILVFRDLYDRS